MTLALSAGLRRAPGGTRCRQGRRSLREQSAPYSGKVRAVVVGSALTDCMYGLYPEPLIDDPAGDVREQVAHGDFAPAGTDELLVR